MIRFLILALIGAGFAVAVFISCSNLEKKAYGDVELAKSEPSFCDTDRKDPLIAESDLAPLPEAARRYFSHAGVVGKPRVSAFSVILKGRIRSSRKAAWMPIVMRQFNRADVPARVVYIESPGKPVTGIDSYLAGKGRMLIKFANLITLSDSTGTEMNRSALVTFMNDLVLCPPAYFSLPLVWKEIDRNTIELSLTHKGVTVTAQLFIDADGRIIDWKSADRYADVKGKNVADLWSTPYTGEKELSGVRIPERGAGIHDFDGTPFAYVELDTISSLVLDAETLPDRE